MAMVERYETRFGGLSWLDQFAPQNFFISTGLLHSWEQISSTAPYRAGGSLRYRLTSSTLPAPGEMGFGVGLETQIDAQPSAADIIRQRDQTARALIKSEISISMTTRVRVRSVSEFAITNAYLQVWGD